ncbi:hypothetical protein MycrhN_3009 [Mycolicibacterium rhodesiae NBB3]|uniref:Uncharacterized protein n=1 Tax=Mycolicibacterium rhodesiae (strain NBB3) TaxID=710685 RepID=G8RKE9_MYCRN|nr:hypothetical protein [Mycolicibacterium rhodesiae]AEV73551.1 hypothetical protein MycrhN_3009 [Mycolicibacterium rhodesiae NBB3]
MRRKAVPLAWAGVTLVGVIVVILVVSWQLFPRLTAAQTMVEDLNPAFTVERVDGARGGLELVSAAVDAVNPMVKADGVAAEMPKLIDLVAQRTGLSDEEALALLRKDYPHITGLLTSAPFEDVAAEIPKLVHYLGTALFMTPDEVQDMLQRDYPKIYQVTQNFPVLIDGWNAVPGTEALTRFDGTPVRTMPQARDYLSEELIGPVERQQGNFRPLGVRGGVGFLAPLLLVLGIVVIIFGTTMVVLTWRRVPPNPIRFAWVVVPVVGAAVVMLVLALNLFPRLIGGQVLLDDTRPAFASSRIEGDRAAVEHISVFVNSLGPAVLPDRGVATEYPALLDHVAKEVGVPTERVLELVHSFFPRTAALLDAVPFSAATAEIPKLVDFLASTSNVTTDRMWESLRVDFPEVHQFLTNLPDITNWWAAVPGTENLTRFDGSPAHSGPQVRDYFLDDVIPALERQQPNYVIVDTNWPQLTVFAPLLTAVGVLVVIYGLFLGYLTHKQFQREREGPGPPTQTYDEPAPPTPIPQEAGRG